MIAKMAMAETPNIEKTVFSRKVKRVLGLDLHSWEQLMLFSLGIAGLIAVAVFVTTASVVILQRHETVEAKRELEEYKLSAESKVADAKKEGIEAGKMAGNALVRSEELRAANLALEAQIAPRRLTTPQQQKIADSLVKYAGRSVEIGSYAMDAESAVLGKQILVSLGAARLSATDRIASVSVLGGFLLGIHVSGPDEDFVTAIRKALVEAGAIVASKEQTSPSSGHAGMSLGNPDAPPKAASIFVGVKPITQ
jgi:hypothetical protein